MADDLVLDRLSALLEAIGSDRRLGPGDLQKLARVRLLLASRGIVPTSPEAADWFAPVLCVTPVEFAGFLAGFDRAMQGIGTSGAALPPDEKIIPRSHIRSALLSVACALGAGALVVAAIRLLDRQEVDPTLSAFIQRFSNAGSPEPLAAPHGPMFLPWLAATGLAVIPLILAGAWLLLDRLRRYRLSRRVAPNPERARECLLGSEAPLLFAGLERSRPVANLRRRVEVPGARIDAIASVRATIAAAGIPVLRRRERLLSPEWVFALDVRSSRDHLAHLGRVFADRLRAAGLGQRRAEHFGNLAALRLDAAVARDGRRVSMADLRGENSPVRLIAFAEAHDCVGGLSDAVEPPGFARGDVLLDPREPGTWDWRERVLRESGVRIVPLAGLPESDGTLKGHEVSQSDDLVARLDPERTALLSDDPPEPFEVAELLVDLSCQLGEESMRWLRALAIFPLVEPALTLLIGQRLTAASGAAVLSDGRAIAISRLPWLRAGRMPDWLRLALAQGSRPEDVEVAASAIQSFLLPKVGPDGTARISVGEHGRDRQALIEWLRRDRESGYADALVLDAMRGRQPDQLGVRAPSALKRAVRAARNHRFAVAMVPTAVAVLGASFLLLPRVDGSAPSAGSNTAARGPAPARSTDTAVVDAAAGKAEVEADTTGSIGNAVDAATSDTMEAALENVVESDSGSASPGAGDEPLPQGTQGPFIVFFEYDRSDITPEAATILDNVVMAAKSGNYRVLIAGHTDTSVTGSYAVGLSQREADSVRSYLEGQGIPSESIETTAFGSSRPRVKTPQGIRELQNRRVEINLIPR